MNEETQILRTVADFRSVPDGQLHNCLLAFRSWLDEERSAGKREPDAFVWCPQARAARAPLPAPAAGTDVRRLGLRPSAVVQLARMNILTLADFARISEQELSCVVNVGAATVAKVRAMLHAVGLELRPGAPVVASAPPAPPARRLPAAQVTDHTQVADLGLRAPTAKKLLLRGIRTVGELRDLAPADFQRMLSLQRRSEVYRLLHAHGMGLRCNPSGLQLWRSGLLRIEDLQRPADDAGVHELQPWLGAVALALERSGVESVGALRALAASGVVRRVEHGLGPYAWTRIRSYFGMSRNDMLALEAVQ